MHLIFNGLFLLISKIKLRRKMNFKVCQCCLIKCDSSESDMKEKISSYSVLINQTFNLNISSDNLICKQCIQSTQDAYNFKTKIMKSQEELKLNLDKITKEMMFFLDIDQKEANNEAGNYTEPVKPLPYKGKTKEIYTSEFQEYIGIKEEKNDLLISPDYCKRIKNPPGIREDSIKLLTYSNICIFKSLKTKFQCFNCKETFVNISELRSHSQTHLNTNRKELKLNLYGYTYRNADISSLTCNLCEQKCNDLKLLKNHLENKHSIEFFTNEHMFVEYKLEDGFKCVLCDMKFNTFVSLSSHMNSHSRNNVCERCGVFFINRISLRSHVKSVHSENKCSICLAKFENSYAKTKHMRIYHKVGTNKRYCNLCNEVFIHSYRLNEHKIEVHGFKRETANCEVCGKSFNSLRNLKVHSRSVHTKERNYACSVCGMRFFTKADERRHGTRHVDVKSISCSFCEVLFKSKDSWKRHLKRLHSNQFLSNK